MSVVEKIAALHTDNRLEKVRRQAGEMGKQVEKISGKKFNPKAKYEGYDISKKFTPVARPSLFKTRVG